MVERSLVWADLIMSNQPMDLVNIISQCAILYHRRGEQVSAETTGDISVEITHSIDTMRIKYTRTHTTSPSLT